MKGDKLGCNSLHQIKSQKRQKIFSYHESIFKSH
jgi:hypothetical protein